MKDSVTKFDFDDAFKALDEIEIPVAEKGIRANRIDLKESMRKVDKFELLFEDFYDVNNADDMNTVSEEREAEVAKAKLARIEKIVDLDAETEDDILPSYVGKTIIQCPQCMTLFYKDAEDIVRDEENPDVVNINEVCQHCGNESGYDVVGKVAEETEATPGDELGTEDFSAEVGDGENDIAIDDGNETTEEAPAEEGGEVDELSAEADLDSVDLDAELEPEEEPVEDEEEETNESLNTSELLKEIEDKNELKTEHESEKLTLNENVITETLELESSSKQLNDFATAIHKAFEAKNLNNIGVSTAASKCKWGSGGHIMITSSDNETDRNAEILKQFALKVLEKAGAKAEIAKIERANGATFIILDNILATQTATAQVAAPKQQAALKEDIEDNLDDKLKAHEEYIKELRDTISELEKKLASTKNEQIKTSIQSRIDATRAELEAALPEAVKVEAETEELPDATEAGMEDATDNTSDETEVTTESLTESVTNVSEADINKLFNSEEFKKPVSEEEVESYFESVDADLKEGEATIEKDTNPVELTKQQKDSEEKTDSETTPEIKAEVRMGAPITTEESESLGELTEANIFAKMWEKGKEWMQKTGMYDTMLAVAKVDKAYSLCSIPFLDPKSLGMSSASISDFPAYNSIQVLDIETFAKTYGIEGSDAAKKFKAAFAPQMTNFKKLVASNYRSDSYTTLAGGSPITDISAPIAEVWIILTKNISKADLSDKSKLKALINTAKTNLDSGATGKTDARIVGKYTSSGFDFKLKNVSGDAQGLMGQSIGDAAKNEVEAETKDTKKATLETIKAKYTGKFSLVYPITVDKTQWTCIKTAIEIDDLQKELTAAAETYTTSEIYGIADTVINTVGNFTLDEAGIAQVKNATLFKSKDHGAKVVSSIQNFYIAVNADNNFKESLQFEDIDEDSFTKQLTESLKDVYENVDSFTMTECASSNNKLIIEGLITFNSGKTKKTSYIFETCNMPDTELIMLEGTNKDLFETGTIKITAKVLEESLYAQTLQYKYSINKTLVEGIINN